MSAGSKTSAVRFGPTLVVTGCLGSEPLQNVLHQGGRKRTTARSAPGQDTRSGQGGSRSQTRFTQDDGYVRGVAADALRLFGSSSTSSSRLFGQTPILPYNWVLDTDTGTGPIPPVSVSRVNAYSGGELARALPEGLRYLST